MAGRASFWTQGVLTTALLTGLIVPHPSLWAADEQARKSSLAIKLDVDATEITRKLVRARLTIPAEPGPLVLYYPKWVPGAHGPGGPIGNVGGLKLSAAGKAISWRRDTLDLYAFHCEIPPGATAVEAEVAYVPPYHPPPLVVSLGIVSSNQLAILNWNALVLYPQRRTAADLTITASLRLPQGWKHASALPVDGPTTSELHFEPVPLPRLIDSPVLAGAHLRSIPLSLKKDVPHQLDVAAENDKDLQLSAEFINGLTRVAAEAGALFGTRHYRSFHFLLALSDRVPSFGLEHHESSVNSASPRAFQGDTASKWWLTFLMPHEYTHSWNGKYRRPALMVTRDYQQPQQTELLWVYEGLTQYLGLLLDARSGLWTDRQFREELAGTAANLDRPWGRTWRPLLDTAIAAPLHANAGGHNWRGISDYYYEGVLIWLEADVLIRRQTQGRRSLDDFCRRFFGGKNTGPAVVGYTFEDVLEALNATAPHDWRTFFNCRLTSTEPRAPLGGIRQSGWRLVYSEVPRERGGAPDLSYSLGLVVGADGTIHEVLHDMPGARAGLNPGMKITAINQRRWSADELRAALKAAKQEKKPLDLLVDEGEVLQTYHVDYHEGEKHPHLERDSDWPDLLATILKPLTPRDEKP
jgi:predicted metalloprotease with PDZ domain